METKHNASLIDENNDGADAEPATAALAAAAATSEQHLMGFVAHGKYRYAKDILSCGYKMEEAIGRGLDAVVFRATAVDENGAPSSATEPVAIKVLQKSRLLARKARKMNRLRNEISIWQSLKHPSVIEFYSVVEIEEACCIVCELAKMELFDALTEMNEMNEYDCKLVLAQIFAGLSHLHQLSIAHRDLKSANILCMHDRLTEAGCVKLADLGFATRISDPQAVELEDNCGTLEYYSPELCENMLARIGKEEPIFYSAAVDCWALGCVMYECIAGEPPFWSEDDVEQVHIILRNRLEFPADAFGTISSGAIALITGLLCPDPKARLTIAQCLRHAWFAGETSDVERRLYPKLPDMMGKRSATASRRSSDDYQNHFRRPRASIVEALNVSEFVHDLHSEGIEQRIEELETKELKAKAGYVRDVRNNRRSTGDATHAMDSTRNTEITDENGKRISLEMGKGVSLEIDENLRPKGDGDWRGPYARRGSEDLVTDVTAAFESLNRASAAPAAE